MNEELIGLIPAAGKGLRLGLPYPKELYPIIRNNRYKPVAQFVVENMVASGITHIVFVINETKHQLIGYFGDGSRFGCHISYVMQESRDDKKKSTSPGLAHALDSAYHLTRNKTVCFGMADTIMTPKDLFGRILREMEVTDAVLLGLFHTDHPEKFGMVEMENNLRVVKIIDKPIDTVLDYMWGCIVWQPIFTEFLHNCISYEKTFDFASAMNLAINDGLVSRGIMIENGSYNDLGTYEEIRNLDEKSRELN
jgi:glucose-1-phosphate thymidylyltransferase